MDTLFFTAAGITAPSAAQQRLVAGYLERLARRCNQLPLAGTVRVAGADAGPPPALGPVYVALAATTWAPVREAAHVYEFASELASGSPDRDPPDAARRVVEAPGDDGRPRYRLERPLLLAEALSQRRRVALLGDPGGGKSSFLRHLAIALARPESGDPPPGWSAGRPLPLYISLGAFGAWARGQPGPALDGAGLWRYLLSVARQDGLEGFDQPLERALREGGLLLLLDGLDEVTDPALRVAVAGAVASLAESGARVALTCRTRAFTGAVAEAVAAWGAPVALAPFSLGQIRHLVRAWRERLVAQGAIERGAANWYAKLVVSDLMKAPDLRELGQNPLLLARIATLYFNGKEFPEARADLYEDLVQLLLVHWPRQRRAPGPAPGPVDELNASEPLPGFDEERLRRTLEELAFRAHAGWPARDGRGSLDRGQALGILTSALTRFTPDADLAAARAEGALGHLEGECALLLAEDGGRYRLPHLSYEQYLAACHLSRQPDFAPVAYAAWAANPDRWREAIVLALRRLARDERRETVAGWMNHLLEPSRGDPAERQRAAFLAALCLHETGGQNRLLGAQTVDLPELWARMAAALAQVVEGTAMPAADRARAGAWLGMLGDPRIPATREAWLIAGDPQAHPASPLARYWRPVPGGSFVIGVTAAEYARMPAAEQAHFADACNDVAVTIAGLELARYPVTNGQYALFMEHGGYDPAAPWWDEAARAWLARDDRAAGLEQWERRADKERPEFWNEEDIHERYNQPVVGICWYEAMAFCRWLTAYLDDGCQYDLPGEAEWEYAARGPARRIYPWGDAEPDMERANFDQIYPGITAAGCFPAGATPEGALDMAGNVWEWTRSAYRSYPYDPGDGREDGPDPECDLIVIRGGSWSDAPAHLRAARRAHSAPDLHSEAGGFRLVRRRSAPRG